MSIERKDFPLHSPFVITGYTFLELNAVWVTLEKDGVVGRGEGVGAYYLGDDQAKMLRDLEEIKPRVEQGATRQEINELMPSNGGRNALDAAMWDLECKIAKASIWDLVGLKPKQLSTVATIGIGTPEKMALRAQELSGFSNLKIKLDDHLPVEKLTAIRLARPDANLVVDANQGWNFEQLKKFIPALNDLGVNMIEQPLARGNDSQLDGFVSSIPLGGDESVLNLKEYEANSKNYQVINIKLDKCGGLTEALQIVAAAQKDGKSIMVGNMTGTSLSMAPAYVIGQHCDFVDIDGPLLIAKDIPNGLNYMAGGKVEVFSSKLWG